MDQYTRRAQLILQQADALAAISEDITGITRTYGTTAFLQGRTLVASWMQQAGIPTTIDQIGNIRGRWPSKNPAAKTFVIASHIDTVVNAGRYDGPLGVLMGLDLLAQIIQHKIELPFHLELIAFCDEEGVRFHTTYLGSKAVAGSFTPELLAVADGNGTTLAQAMASMGHPEGAVSLAAIPASDWLGYFEIHIEQGPVLYENKVPVAVVTSIAGQQRAEIVFTGMAGHAGTVPMAMRQDALCCAAEFILAVEKFALSQQQLVATVGKLQVQGGASNVIPGQVVCSLDVRSADAAVLASGYKSLQDVCAKLCQQRGIAFQWNAIQASAPVQCSPALQSLLENAVANSGLPVVQLVSGAGHDAVPISQVAPVSMLFVRCYKGISHHPLENVELPDVAAAVQVADSFLQLLAAAH